MPRHVKFYTVPGERGFPQYVIRESVSEQGTVHRQMVATCNEAKFVGDIIDRLNDSETCRQEHS